MGHLFKTRKSCKYSFVFKSTSKYKLTVSKCFSNVVRHCDHAGDVDLGGVHKLTLVGAACQLAEEVYQIKKTGGTPAHGSRKSQVKKTSINTIIKVNF